MSDRLISGMASSVVLLGPLGLLLTVLAFLAGASAIGLLLFFSLLLLVPVALVLALYCVLTMRCRECGEKFFATWFVALPVQTKCQHCGARKSMALE